MVQRKRYYLGAILEPTEEVNPLKTPVAILAGNHCVRFRLVDTFSANGEAELRTNLEKSRRAINNIAAKHPGDNQTSFETLVLLELVVRLDKCEPTIRTIPRSDLPEEYRDLLEFLDKNKLFFCCLVDLVGSNNLVGLIIPPEKKPTSETLRTMRTSSRGKATTNPPAFQKTT